MNNDDLPSPRPRVGTVMVGVDGSQGADHATAWATARCCETGADLLAVHVLTYSAELYRDLPPSGMTNWRREVRSKLAEEWTASARAAGVPVRCLLIEHESVADGLLAVAHQEHVDLVVLGAHSFGNLADRLLGSTTYRVAHRALVPVVIIPPRWALAGLGGPAPA